MELVGFGEFEGAQLLQKLHLFQRLTFDETNRLAGIIEYVDVKAGSVIIEQNALGDALYVLLDGECVVSRDVNQDGAHSDIEEIGRLGPGDLFGEMSLVDDLLTSARVTAMTGCRLAKMPRAKFEALLQADERLAAKVYKGFCRTLSDRLRKTSALLARSHALAAGVR